MGVSHILEVNVGRITQYADESFLDDKWHFGNLTANAATPSLNAVQVTASLFSSLKDDYK